MELSNEFRVGVPPAVAWSVLTDVERIAPCMPGAQLQEIEGDEYRGVVKVKVGPITAQYKGKATFLERDEPAGRLVLRAEGRDTRGQGNANATITASLQSDGDGTKVSVVTDLTVTGKVAQFGRGVLAEVSAKLLNQFVDCLERDVLAAGDHDQHPAPAGAGAGAPDGPGVADGPEGAAVDAGSGAAMAEAVPAATAVEAEPVPAATAVEAEPVPAATSAAAAASASAEGGPGPPAGGATPTPAQSPGSSAARGSDTNGSGPDSPTAGQVRRIDHPEAAPVDLLDAAGASVARRLVPVLAGILAVVLLVVRRRRRAAVRRGR